MSQNLSQYAFNRLLQLFPVLFGVSVVTFLLMHVAPGGPAYALLGVKATPEKVAQIRQQYNLNQPIYIQYLTWIWNVLHGDLGQSITRSRPVASLLVDRLPVSLSLAIFAMIISLTISIPAGIIGAVKKDQLPDTIARVFAFWGISMPNFWLGILLILIFGVKLSVLPVYGYVSPFKDPIAGIKHLILPAITLGTALAAIVTRMTRSSVVEALNEDYIETAKAKGAPTTLIVLKHGLRNGLIPVVTIVGIQLAYVLGGSVLVEQVFSLPGVGRLLISAVFQRDFPVVQGVVLIYALIFVGTNLIVDLLYAIIDPTIQY
ncbi:MAG: ABC transporter permease [Halobacteriaceae archaeon]